MRKNAKEVVAAFKNKEACGGGGIWTDGKAIYSYKMKIAWRKKDGSFAVASYESSPSNTTTQHIHGCLVGLGVSLSDTVKVKRPALTNKAPHGHGQMVSSKRAAQGLVIKPGVNVFRVLPPKGSKKFEMFFPSIPEETAGYGVEAPIVHKPLKINNHKPKYTPVRE